MCPWPGGGGSGQTKREEPSGIRGSHNFNMPDKLKIPLAEAVEVADWLVDRLAPACHRIVVAGSIRRRKPMVSDIEILYTAKVATGPSPDDLFAPLEVNCADQAIRELEREIILKRRLNKVGNETFGPLNKLMVHVASGIPVDLFASTERNFHNALVMRTGPRELNERIAVAARKKGFTWKVYGSGFENLTTGEVVVVTSEREVFSVVDLPYAEPEHRL
jgi:DNA polymerase/3'-5' exonuclease PolX